MARGSDVSSILSKVPYFAGLPPPLVRTLADMARLRDYRQGEVILWEGDPCEGLYVVLSGRVKVFKRSGEGREQVLRVLGPGRTFNDVPVFDGGLNPGSVAPLDAARVAILPKARVLALVQQHPAVAMAVIGVLADRLRGLTVLVEDLMLRNVTARVAKILMDWAGGQTTLVEGAEAGCVRLTQTQLAAMTGSVREVVQRALKTLERDGAIRLSRARICVLDLPSLRRWSESGAGADAAQP
jgi:CRP/FNR family transcriptional regulator